jgi:hypothetical protein
VQSRLTVVIPFRGASGPAGPLACLGGEFPLEVLVAAAADSPPAALATWEAAGARVIVGSGPRGARQRAAAREAAGDVLLFLHADTDLPRGGISEVDRCVRGGAGWGTFRLAFSGGDPRLRFVAACANVRSRVTGIPFGDQALFVRRALYERAGGHPDWPILDDLELARRLRRIQRPVFLAACVRTSPERYLARGVTRTVLTNWSILLRFAAGAPVSRLAASYWRDSTE